MVLPDMILEVLLVLRLRNKFPRHMALKWNIQATLPRIHASTLSIIVQAIFLVKLHLCKYNGIEYCLSIYVITDQKRIDYEMSAVISDAQTRSIEA